MSETLKFCINCVAIVSKCALIGNIFVWLCRWGIVVVLVQPVMTLRTVFNSVKFVMV